MVQTTVTVEVVKLKKLEFKCIGTDFSLIVIDITVSSAEYEIGIVAVTKLPGNVKVVM